MYLQRIQIDPRCREARRDLADPYQLHSTLCRAFSNPEKKCSDGEFLWRLEQNNDYFSCPRIIVQSRGVPDWTKIGVKGWLAKADPAIDLKKRLQLDSLKSGQRFRFRLQANPSITRNGKRFGLLRTIEQEAWVKRKGVQHGFIMPQCSPFDFSESQQERVDGRITQARMLSGRQHSGNTVRLFSVLYDGTLIINEPDKFRQALQTGIGHGKVLGLGLLSVVPMF